MSVNQFIKFVIRIILATFGAVFVTRFFYPKATIAGIVAVAILLVGMAYVMEYFHNRKKGP